MKQDNQTIVLMHLSQLVTLALSFGSILIPLYHLDDQKGSHQRLRCPWKKHS